MKQLIQLTKSIPFFVIALVLACFGLAPLSWAVVPAPDGGYPGGNTAEGQNALFSLTTGGFNTAVGFLSLRSDTTSGFNTAFGAGTLLANTADDNTATGAGALLSNVTGFGNTANGAFALFNNTGGFNTAIGFEALFNNTTGSGNTALGVDAGNGVTTASSVICIGISGANVTNSCFIGNIFGVTSSGGTAVLINGNGQLGTTTSSRRFKEEIRPMEQASEVLFGLKPVTFHYKKGIDPQRIPQFGLVAEEVEKVNPDLVVRDKEGKPYSVRYDQVNAMLLNEFLKEHCTVQEQGATMTQQRKDFETAIAQQQKQIEALTATVKEQAAQIQKVSAQLELSKPAQQTVLNRQ